MPLSNSVIRRYTPPTCTLEVWAQSSPLSRWMGKTVLKQLNFELRFDNPQVPEESRVVIRGDRDQLEALCDAVTNYVQEFLHQTPDHFWVSFSGPQDSSKVSDESALTELQQSSLAASTKTLKAFNSQISGTKIYLEPSNYLTHNLFLGSLANQSSSPVVQLSLLQLFDLATALDEYSAEVMALPNLHRSNSSYNWPAWTSVAAVLALGVGLLPVTLQYVNQSKPKQQIATQSAPASPEVAIQAPSALNLATPQPGLTPADSFPPVPGLDTTPPPPSSSLPVPPLSVPNTQASPGAVVATSPGNNTALARNSQLPTSPVAGGQQIAIAPTPPGTVATSEVAVPIKRNLPPSLSPTPGNVPPSLPAIPNSNTVAEAPINPQLFPGELNPVSTNPSIANEKNSLAVRLRNTRQAAPPKEVATGTLFDTPLVTEAREYFQKRWQPPTGLTETLEYSLIVAVDGTIERILPLNKPAREYINSTGIPDIGKPFVSPSKVGRNLRIRAVLSPDGKVKVLPETE
jgi:hypothetical protein